MMQVIQDLQGNQGQTTVAVVLRALQEHGQEVKRMIKGIMDLH